MQLADARVSERPLFSERDQWFESISLQRRVNRPSVPHGEGGAGAEALVEATRVALSRVHNDPSLIEPIAVGVY
jgi:hypothetical protein